MLPAIGAIISAVSAVGSKWLETRKIKAEGRIKITHAKIDAKIARETAKATMDMAAMTGMQHSWKDEYLTILWSIPVIMCFIPFLADYALRGFQILAATPDWYRWCFIGIVTATFGLRTWTGWRK